MTVKKAALYSMRDPASWVAFLGTVVGGVQTLLAAQDLGLSARSMSLLLFGFGVVGLIIRAFEMAFLRRAQAAAESEQDEKP